MKLGVVVALSEFFSNIFQRELCIRFCKNAVFNFIFLFFIGTPVLAIEDVDGALSFTQNEVALVGYDGVSYYEFVQKDDFVFQQQPAKDLEFKGDLFDQNMQELSETAWFYPYTVESGSSPEMQFSTQFYQGSEETRLRENDTIRIELLDDFSGTLKLLGQLGNPEAKFASILFVTPHLDNSRSDILVVYPTFTYQAYSSFGEPSLYKQEPKENQPMTLSLNRPFLLSLEQSSFHSPLNHGIVPFLQKNDYEFDVVDNLYLHETPSVLQNYKLVIIAGHDEYWTYNIRKAYDDYLENDGRILNISGNLGWWKILVENDKIVVDRNNPKENRENRAIWTGQTKFVYPIEQTFGISYQFAGYPLSRKSENYSDLEALQLQGKSFPENEYDSNKDSIKLLDRAHPIFEDVISEEWIGQDKELLAVEIDGVPLSEDDQINEKFLSRLGGRVNVLAVAWAIYGKQLRYIGIISEYKPNSGGQVLSIGSIGWQENIDIDEDVATITRNAINFLLNES